MPEEEVQNNIAAEEGAAPEEQLDELSDYEKAEEKKKKIIYMVVFVVQIILAFVIIKFLVLPWYQGNDNTEYEEEFTEPKVRPQQRELGHIFTISDLTVNPSGSRGRRFAVFEIAFSVPEEEQVEKMKKYETVIKDQFIQYFRSKTVEELSSDSAMAIIKLDLIDLTANIIGNNDIYDVYFTRFILQ